MITKKDKQKLLDAIDAYRERIWEGKPVVDPEVRAFQIKQHQMTLIFDFLLEEDVPLNRVLKISNLLNV